MPTEYTGLPTAAERAEFKRAEVHRAHLCETCVANAYNAGYADAHPDAELDVVRLAAALLNVLGSNPDDTGDAGILFAGKISSAIAREYAALAPGANR